MIPRQSRKKKGLPFEARQVAPSAPPPLPPPKKIDGEWRFPLGTKIPDSLMYCPVCHKKAERIPKKTGPAGQVVFRCINKPGCTVKEFMEKPKRHAWCEKHNQWVIGKQCKNCHEMLLHAEEWKAEKKGCPYFHMPTEEEETPEQYTKL